MLTISCADLGKPAGRQYKVQNRRDKCRKTTIRNTSTITSVINHAKNRSVSNQTLHRPTQAATHRRKSLLGDNHVQVEWAELARYIAMAGGVAAGVEKVIKLYKRMKMVSRIEAHQLQGASGLTVKNGEYRDMMTTLTRIDRRVDRLVGRVQSIEERLST